MTLAQVKTYVIGVLKGWFTNKSVLDKLSESDTGELLYDSKTISGGETVTEDEIAQAITDTIADLNTTTE